MKALSEYKENINSQHGEDGIIKELLNRLEETTELDFWCVEFGAWDGIYLSNTYNLIKNRGYNAVLIEANEGKFKELQKNLPTDNVIKINNFVEFDGEHTLDNILCSTEIPKKFDFLSIDIDGCDYHIFDSLQIIKPKIICIEYNPAIPNHTRFVQEKDFSVQHGSSPLSFVELAGKKGYGLVAITHSNLFFVDESLLIEGSKITRASLSELRDDSQFGMTIFAGYDGTILSDRPKLTLNWHRFSLYIEDIQPVPKFLRKFGDDYKLIDKIMLFIVLAMKYPGQIIKRVAKILRSN